MASKTQIDEFLSNKNPAIIRYSRDTKITGIPIEDVLVLKGYQVSFIYLVNDEPTRPLSYLAPYVDDAVIISVDPRYAVQAVNEVIAAKMTQVWFRKGSESAEAVALCTANGITAITGECILMYAEPVKSIHAFHRGVWKMIGKYAR